METYQDVLGEIVSTERKLRRLKEILQSKCRHTNIRYGEECSDWPEWCKCDDCGAYADGFTNPEYLKTLKKAYIKNNK